MNNLFIKMFLLVGDTLSLKDGKVRLFNSFYNRDDDVQKTNIKMLSIIEGVKLQFKLDLRNRSVFLTYYVIPLVFFLFMGGIFSSIQSR